MHLKSSLKIDYWNYNKLGDRERARGEVKNGAEQSASPNPGG